MNRSLALASALMFSFGMAAPKLQMVQLPAILGQTWYGLDGSATVSLSTHTGHVGEVVFTAGSVDLSKDTTTLSCQAIRYLGVQGGSLVLQLIKSTGILSATIGTGVDRVTFEQMRSKDNFVSSAVFSAECEDPIYTKALTQQTQTIFIPLGSKFYLSAFLQELSFDIKPDEKMKVLPIVNLE